MKQRIFFIFMSGITFCNATGQSVDPLSGTLQMSIPLGQLQANDITIPIGVYNHGGSLRVAEGEGDCGLGWNFSAGNFSVSRIVRGLPDEINSTDRKGWLYNNNAQTVQNFSPAANDDLSDCSDEINDWDYINTKFGSYVNDSEPDLYFINAPGLSAQFVFGPDRRPKLLTHQDLVIQYYRDSLTYIDSITVKTNNGMVYKFKNGQGIKRRSYLGADDTNINTAAQYFHNKEWAFITQWKLTSISSSATGTTAKFYYSAIPGGAGKQFLSIDSLNFNLDVYTTLRLDSISLKSYRAYFTWSNSLLQKITIKETNTLDRREFAFEYKSASHPNAVSKALLSNIRLIGGTCLPYEAYNFEYQSIDFGFSWATKPAYVDWKKNWGQDFFGYPNGNASNKNFPTLHAYYGESDGRRLRVVMFTGITPSATITGQSRGPNSEIYSYGALTKVVFPTGGFTQIEWEPNSYMDNSTSQFLTGGGLRVKKLISQGGEAAFGKTISDVNGYRAIVKEYEYTLAGSSASSGLLLSPIKLGYIHATGIRQSVHNLGEEPEILYSRVKEKITGQGSTVYEYNVPGVFPETTSGEWKATKSRIARPAGGCVSAGNIKNGYYTFPYPPSSNFGFKRGQLSRASEYNEAGTLIREKIYTYAPRTSNPSTIKGLRFEKLGIIYHYGIYEILTGRMEVIVQEMVKEASHEDPGKWFQTTTNYSYNANHMLETITSVLPDNTVTIKRLKYAKDFLFTSPPATDTSAVAIMALNNSNRGSELVEQITKVTLPGSTETVSSQLVLYRDFGGNRIMPYYIKILPQGASLTEASASAGNFVSDTDYRLIQTLKEYDSEGRLLTAVDDKRNYLARHYALATSFPLATFSDIKAQQAIYEGFEMTSSFGLAASGTEIQYPSGWTGSKAIRFTNSTASLTSSSTNLILKNGDKYRVSCWVYSAANKTVTFHAKVSGSMVSTLILTNTVNNAWNYLEGVLNVSGVSNAFTLEIVTNASSTEPVTLDDIICMPEHSRISLQTILPFKGVTSATDDRGNSVKNVYDPMGRLTSTLDRNRNLVQKNEYVFKNMQSPVPFPHFTSSVEQYFVNTPIDFRPVGNFPCDAGVVYAWEVDGAAQPNGAENTLTYSFATPGQHTVRLTATSSSGASKMFPLPICVEYQFTGTISYTVTDSNGNPAGLTLDCNSGVRYIRLNIPSVPTGCSFSISWTLDGQPYGSGDVISVVGYSPSGSEPVTKTYAASVVMDCAAYKDCTFSSPIGYRGTVNVDVTYMPNPNCQ